MVKIEESVFSRVPKMNLILFFSRIFYLFPPRNSCRQHLTNLEPGVSILNKKLTDVLTALLNHLFEVV